VNTPLRLQAAALLMTTWIGAALLTVAVVAPGAFAVLPTRTMAGTLVGRVLPALFVAGIVIGLLVAAAAGKPWLPGPSRKAALAALMAAGACGIAQFAVTPKLDRLRAEIGGPVDALAATDPRRVAFGLLHGYNVAGLALAMAGAVACLAFLLFAIRPRS
jgi:uncharacterized protein DUF4149